MFLVQRQQREGGQHPPSGDGTSTEAAAEGGQESRLTRKGVAMAKQCKVNTPC